MSERLFSDASKHEKLTYYHIYSILFISMSLSLFYLSFSLYFAHELEKLEQQNWHSKLMIVYSVMNYEFTFAQFSMLLHLF